MAREITSSFPLSGLRVLELGYFMAGPYCGMLLADLGAEVVKIENPQGGDFSRGQGPFIEGESAGFMAVNRNKKSLALNLKAERGRDLFLRLVAGADVVVENYRPGTMDDLGLGYARLTALNPRLVYSVASGYGQTGPYRDRAALDLIIQGMSGLMSITGEPGRPPVKLGVPAADLSAALFGANAILAALFLRERTGRGQLIDVSLLETALALQVWETSSFFATGEVPAPLGSAHRVSAPYQAFRTSDGYITLGATTPALWHSFCVALNLAPLETDPRFAFVSDRRARYRELAAQIETITVREPSAHWYTLLDRAGIPCGILNRIDQVLADEQVQARGVVVELPHARAGQVKATRPPVHFSESPVRLERAGPLLGQDTAAVLAGLGLSPDEIALLEQEGVVRSS